MKDIGEKFIDGRLINLEKEDISNLKMKLELEMI